MPLRYIWLCGEVLLFCPNCFPLSFTSLFWSYWLSTRLCAHAHAQRQHGQCGTSPLAKGAHRFTPLLYPDSKFHSRSGTSLSFPPGLYLAGFWYEPMSTQSEVVLTFPGVMWANTSSLWEDANKGLAKCNLVNQYVYWAHLQDIGEGLITEVCVKPIQLRYNSFPPYHR